MNNNSLNAYDVQGMSKQEMKQTDGGFIPLVILGVAFSAKTVASCIIACFAVGVAIGAS